MLSIHGVGLSSVSFIIVYLVRKDTNFKHKLRSWQALTAEPQAAPPAAGKSLRLLPTHALIRPPVVTSSHFRYSIFRKVPVLSRLGEKNKKIQATSLLYDWEVSMLKALIVLFTSCRLFHKQQTAAVVCWHPFPFLDGGIVLLTTALLVLCTWDIIIG